MPDHASRLTRGGRLRAALFLLAALLLMGTAVALHWDDQVRLAWQERQTGPAVREASIWLPDYRLVHEVSLPGLEQDETSGLTWSPLTGTLFTVTGQNPQLVELSPGGVILRRIRLDGFSDPEAVTSLDDGRLAIVDERQRLVAVVQVTPDTERLHLADAATYDLGYPDAGNKGFEGLAWDARASRLMLAKEREPHGLYSLPFPGDDGAAGALQPFSGPGLMVRDLSSVAVDPRSGHMLLLSDESRLLLELDRQGRPRSYIRLLGGLHGLRRSIHQAEGVAMDDAGRIFVVGEPNLFYVFERQGPDR
ncbi:SdiA-regulated domain-containing protein [Stutzerimonas tarimensis]|uniref:SdiA-regulated domain-containing protein n=1 Tax=Stutzerimonas tarimensis TaxID=1507735 RepID=A0ABV7T319_9GAMM